MMLNTHFADQVLRYTLASWMAYTRTDDKAYGKGVYNVKRTKAYRDKGGSGSISIGTIAIDTQQETIEFRLNDGCTVLSSQELKSLSRFVVNLDDTMLIANANTKSPSAS